MDFPGIERAKGLSQEDAQTLDELLDVSQAVESRGRMLDRYYEGESKPDSIGVDNIPDTVGPDVRCDWARKAVTSVSERVRMDGFVFEGDYRDEGLERISRFCAIDDAFNRHVASELTHGCMFATVQRDGDRTTIRMHSARTSAAIWDAAAGRIGAGFVLADSKRFPWTTRPEPAQVNMHLPGRVVIFHRTGSASWEAETMETPLDRPMMEAFCFRATGTKPLGESRITPTVRYLVDEVERTLRYMAVSSAFYATPQRYLLGLSDEQFDAMVGDKWKQIVGSMLLTTVDENGNSPQAGQFSSNSPQPYIDAIQTYAKLFAGATGVPLNSLGIVQDNPSSAEAMDAAREDICIAAEDCIEANRVSMRNVALMAMAVESDTTLDGLTDEQMSVMPHFKNPRTPSLASTADAMTKVASALEGFAQTREFLAGMGFETAEIESIESQLRRAQASSAAAASAQAALIQRQSDSQQASGGGSLSNREPR